MQLVHRAERPPACSFTFIRLYFKLAVRRSELQSILKEFRELEEKV